MTAYKIFVVEDDPWYKNILSYQLSLNPDYDIVCFETAKDCLRNLHKKPDLITIDFSLPDMKGDELYKQIKELAPHIPVIVISSQEEIQIAVSLLKLGVKDYLVKDESTKDLLWNSIIQIRENQTLKQEVEWLKEELEQKYQFSNTLIGQSPVMLKVIKLLEKAVRTPITISITGETGTGKEAVAKAIHYGSLQKKHKFVALNMAGIPKDLAESELFGHEKGASTGAVNRKIGKFEEAHQGTLFLDEIAEMDLTLQAKLLRALQEREFTRIGSNEPIKFDTRIIIATHKNLAQEVEKGNFREDLYFRLMRVPIHLPPLRERGNDVLILAKHFSDVFTKANKIKPISFSEKAKEKILQYPFPGNVRELKAAIELAIVMADTSIIDADDLTFINQHNKKEVISFTQNKTLRQYTCEIIKAQLNKYNNDVVTTAKALDIGKSTIYKMIQDGEI